MNIKNAVVFFFIILSIDLFSTNNVIEEKIVLRAHYGFFTAGYAELITEKKDNESFDQASLDFKTTQFVEKLFRFHYAFDSYHDSKYCYPKKSSYHLIEKKLDTEDVVNYFAEGNYLESNLHGRIDFKERPRDILAVIAYLRKIDWQGAKEGDMRSFDVFFTNKEIFPVQIYYQGVEKIKVDSKNYDCTKLFLTSEAGKLFTSDSKIAIYLSNDADRIPVLFSIELLLGSFKLDLAEYSKK